MGGYEFLKNVCVIVLEKRARGRVYLTMFVCCLRETQVAIESQRVEEKKERVGEREKVSV